MTPQLNREPRIASQLDLQLSTDDLHLTSDQMSDLLACALPPHGEDPHMENADTSRAEAHLRACALCASEFACLRESLSLFQEASIAHADREFSRLKKPVFSVLPAQRPYSQTLFWVAASAILMAGILPLEMRWQRSRDASAVTSSHSTGSAAKPVESDEALLEDIDRELSASVPAPMQALADPTAGASTQTVDDTSAQTSSQRKD